MKNAAKSKAKSGQKIDDKTLQGLVTSALSSAERTSSSAETKSREKAIKYYNGEVDAKARKGRSRVTSKDVSDTIGWMLPGLMRVFTASEKMVSFRPTSQNDEAGAKQAQDYVNHKFWNDWNGYRLLWDCLHDALQHANGIIKHTWDSSEKCSYSTMTGMSLMQLAKLNQDPDVDFVSIERTEAPQVTIDPKTNKRLETEVYKVKVKRIHSRGRVNVETVATENFLIDGESRFLDEDETTFAAHMDVKTRSDLISMGFDKKKVEKLQAIDGSSETAEEVERDENKGVGLDGERDKSMDLIRVYECYIKVDVDGDGVAERVRAYIAGSANGELLDWEVWDDELPFTDVVPFRIPHRFIGKSISDETMDIQDVKTALLRQALDNTYASNNPRPEVEQGSIINMEQLYNPTHGTPLITKANTAGVRNWHVTPYTAGNSFTAMEYMDQMKENRTGQSRRANALDPNALQNQTAEAVREGKDSSYSKTEMLARNIAEIGGMQRLFTQLLRLTIRNCDRVETFRLRDEWVTVDPRDWNATMDAKVDVGLGTGSRDRDIAVLNNILSSQIMLTEKFAATGFVAEALDMLPKVIKTLQKIAESAGVKSPETYYPDIDEATLAKMKEKALKQSQEKGGDKEMEAKIQKIMADIKLDQQKMQMEIQLDREKFQQEMALKREQLEAELQLKAYQIQVSATQTQTGTTPVRIGGQGG